MLTLIRCPFHPRVTAVARKRPWSFCQKCRWQDTPKHAHNLDPTTVPRHRGNLSGKRAHTQLVRETLGHSPLNSPSHCGLILTQSVQLVCALKKKRKKKGAGRDRLVQTFSQIHPTRGKKPPPPKSPTETDNSLPRGPVVVKMFYSSLTREFN